MLLGLRVGAAVPLQLCDIGHGTDHSTPALHMVGEHFGARARLFWVHVPAFAYPKGGEDMPHERVGIRRSPNGGLKGGFGGQRRLFIYSPAL